MNENFERGKLRGATAEEVQDLTIAILAGVGVEVDAPASEGDIGVGIYDGQTTVIKTASEVALTEIEDDAFADGLPRLIVVRRLFDNFRLSNFGGNQFEPFFDYDATKLDGTTTNADKVLAPGKFGIIAYCLFPLPFEYPDNVGIGHNPVEGAPNFPFEILPPVDLPVERPDLVEELKCGQLNENPGPPPPPIGMFGGGLPGLASAAWRTADRFLVPLANNVLLPEPLWATAAVGFLGPIGGKTTSLSPFGTVELTETSTSTSLVTGSALAIVGDELTLTATVSPAPAEGEEPLVEFFDGTTLIGTAPTNSDGVATLTTSTLSLVQHSLSAHFSGTPSFSPSSSSPVVQHMIQRFNDLASFNSALGAAARETQDFEEFDTGTPISDVISGVLGVTSTFDNLTVSLLGGEDKILFGSGGTTRQDGEGRYDLTFAPPLSKNALAFNLEAKDPATDAATVIVAAGAGSASFSLQNTSTDEATPAFFGIISSVSVATVGIIEGPEVGGAGNEETALDDFIVAAVTLPLTPVIF
jgi:hypothetical protein